MILKRNNLTFIILLISTIIAGVLLQLLLVRDIKNSIKSNIVDVQFYFSRNVDFRSTLYYSFTDKFNTENKVQIDSSVNNVAIFKIPQTNKLLTNFRLDFGNKPGISLLEIDSMQIKYGNTFLKLKQKQLFEHIFTNSGSVRLNKRENSMIMMPNKEPYDPYIVFDPFVKIILDNHPLRLPALLMPFLIFLSLYIKRWYIRFKPSPLDILLLLFIICIPLKIAWTTFLSIIICLYAISLDIRDRKFKIKNLEGLLLTTLFILTLIIGRPTKLKVIDNQLALVLFAIIICSGIINGRKLSSSYVYFFLILNALFVTTGLSFLLNFSSVFGLSIGDYFNEIKIYSGNIRNWLYYDHAVFLTFFGIVGLLPLKYGCLFKNQKTSVVISYHFLLLGTIILFGARISLLVYLIFLINILIEGSLKWRIIFNVSVFLITAIFLFSFIDYFDSSRFDLWTVSWEAIKDKPLFGYGLGSSDNILHTPEFMHEGRGVIPESLNHAHNQFITFLTEIGFIGLLLLIITIGIYLRRMAQNKTMTMVLFIFGLCYVFLTESILQTSKPLFVLCFLFMMLTSIPANEITNEFDKKP
ncbi:O-antigen ligase family protein [uncultured Maribacter sp.]|uniref:O-antigen ligase family protein n=1 Tax=uncultured Maribacter sp. TaxID=431308 RepID=UPI002638AFF1|nr:O-antigen ligase family protein [uncultured Maribacter sp.]